MERLMAAVAGLDQEREPDPSNPGRAPKYDAFISYSHVDRQVAAGIQKGLAKVGRRMGRLNALRVFRDATDLTAAPSLWGKVTEAMDASRYLVVVCSPASAKSKWVDREVAYWLATRGPDRLMLVTVGGTLRWDERGSRFDRHSNDVALPAMTVPGMFPNEPFFVDVTDLVPWDPKNPVFRETVTDLAAPMHGKSKYELASEDLREQHRFRRWRRAAIAALVVVTLLALVAGLVAVQQRNTAITERYAATSRQLVALSESIEDERPSLARQLLVEAYRLAPTEESVGALIRSPRMAHELRVSGVEPTVAVNPVQPVTAVVAAGRLSLYETDSGRVLETLSSSLPENTDVAFSPSGDSMAVAKARRIELYDVSDSTHVRSQGWLQVHAGVERIRFAPGGNVLIALSGPLLTFSDVSNPSRPVRLKTTPTHRDLVLLDDGTLLSRGTAVRGTDFRALPVPVLVTPLASADGRAVVTPDRQTLAEVGVAGEVRLWDVAAPRRPRLRASLPAESFGVEDLAFSSDGKAFAVGTSSGVTQLWSIEDVTRPILGERLVGVTAPVRSVAFGSRSSELVVVADDPVSPGAWSGTATQSIVRIWPVDGASRDSSTSRIRGGRQAVPAWSANGRSIVAGFPARIWSLDDPRFPLPRAPLPALAVGGGASYAHQPGTNVIASGLPVVLWEASNISAPISLTEERVREPADLASFSSDGTLLATGSVSGPVSLWEISAKGAKRLIVLHGSRAGPHGAVFVAGGRILVSLDDDDRGAVLWDIDDPSQARRLSEMRLPGDAISVLATDEPTSVIVGTSRGTVSVWDLSDPASPRQLWSRQAHLGPMTGLALSSDGLLATAGDDGVRLWAREQRVGTPKPIATLQAGGIYDGAALAFSPNGALLAAATDGDLQIWDVDVRVLLSRLCAESEPITKAQWADYLPADISYDPPCVELASGGSP